MKTTERSRPAGQTTIQGPAVRLRQQAGDVAIDRVLDLAVGLVLLLLAALAVAALGAVAASYLLI